MTEILENENGRGTKIQNNTEYIVDTRKVHK